MTVQQKEEGTNSLPNVEQNKENEDDEVAVAIEGQPLNENQAIENRVFSLEAPSTAANDNEKSAANATNDEQPDPERSLLRKTFGCVMNFYEANSFLILVLLVILIAYAYPPLGATYLAPHITATWVAVVIIFLLSGISLKSEELSKAFQRLRFNAFVQIFNFFVVSSITFGFSRLMIKAGALSQSLADGMVIGTCVPITVNMVMVITKSANGDEAAAIFNAAFGNLTGVFLSPALVLMYLGLSGDIDIGTVFFKLGCRVVLPIAVGQVLHKFSATVMNFVKEHKKKFKKVQEYCLIFIIYTVFCKTFSSERDTTARDAFVMIAFVFLLLSVVMVLAWILLKILFPNQPKLRVMGLFGCSHKSVAMGVPLINAIFEGDPLIGFYTLPLLVWHPMQLVIGSFLAPRLADFVKKEEERLSTNDLALNIEDA